MPWKFNPFSNTLDQTGSGGGGGAAFFAGEVATYADLPLDGTAALNSRWLVRSNSGTWPFSSYKQAGVYVRTGTVGANRDDDYTLTDTSFHDVMSDEAFVLFDNGDATKNLKFQLSGITTGTTRTITVPDANITLDDAGDTRDPNAHAASHAAAGSDPVFDQDLNTGDSPTFVSVSCVGNGTMELDSYGLIWEGSRRWDVETGTFQGVDEQPVLYVPADPSSNSVGVHTSIEFLGASAATNAETTRANLGLGDAAVANIGTAAGEVAEGDHVHGNLTSDGKLGSTSGLPLVTTTAGAVTTLALGTAGQVLQVNSGATGVEFAAASGGDTVSINASAADVLSVSSGAISADDGGTIDSADPFIKWDDTAGKLVYANPLSRPSGAFYVGLAPTTTALGSNAINIQATRSGATNIASGNTSICIGTGGNTASGQDSISIGVGNAVSALRATAVGYANTASGQESIALGSLGFASGVKSVGVNEIAVLRGQVSLLPFRSVYWSGQTTNNTPTILNLDGTATNRFAIAASTALAVDILLVARRSDTQDKWLVARRFLGIRRDGSNNTSLIGSVQTLGTDQSDGSPSWTFALTADDTNEALQLEVTGAASETVQWRATAFYRVV
jgi:phage gp37-like protein